MDISSLRERSFTEPITVSALNEYIKRIFDSDRALTALSVKGEISNFVLHRSGHAYFSVKDEASQIRAVMFSSSVSRLRFMPENGMRVVLHGTCSVYVRDGSYQLYVTSMEPDGVGALYLAYEQLKARLLEEGLFDEARKKPIPRFAERVGVITSPTGAAVRDIINVSKRRFPGVKIYLYPALVQGEGAVDALLKGLDYFDRAGLCDVIIIGRGGGSIEDLWAFNSEKLARRIADMRVPVISAVGHETDFTICDFVSDLRAPTPSAAAELAVPDATAELRYVDLLMERAQTALSNLASRKRERLSSLISHSRLEKPQELFLKPRELLSNSENALYDAILDKISLSRQRLVINAEKANALSPLLTLSRGYSIAEGALGTLKSVGDIKENDEFTLILRDGRVNATARSVIKGKEGIK